MERKGDLENSLAQIMPSLKPKPGASLPLMNSLVRFVILPKDCNSFDYKGIWVVTHAGVTPFLSPMGTCSKSHKDNRIGAIFKTVL